MTRAEGRLRASSTLRTFGGPVARFPVVFVNVLARSVILALCLTPLGAAPPMQSAEFARFVGTYLDDFARRHPSIAAGNGLHAHDAKLDDFSATSITAEIAALKRDAARLHTFDAARLTPDERVDQRILL